MEKKFYPKDQDLTSKSASDGLQKFLAGLDAIIEVSSTALMFCGPEGVAAGTLLSITDIVIQNFVLTDKDESSINTLQTKTTDVISAVSDLLTEKKLIDVTSQVTTFTTWFKAHSQFLKNPSAQQLPWIEVNLTLPCRVPGNR